MIIDGLDPERMSLSHSSTYFKNPFQSEQALVKFIVKFDSGQENRLTLSRLRLMGNYLYGYPKFTQSTNECIGP